MPKSLLLLSLLLTSCIDFPNSYAPSRLRRADTGPDPRGLKPYIDMKDASSLSQCAWGVSPSAFDGEKRKAAPKAALRFHIVNSMGNKLSVDFVSYTRQSIRFKVNGRIVGQINSEGPSHFEAPVAASDFVSGTATLVELDSDSGISILRAGFQRQ